MRRSRRARRAAGARAATRRFRSKPAPRPKTNGIRIISTVKVAQAASISRATTIVRTTAMPIAAKSSQSALATETRVASGITAIASPWPTCA
jgi:hypothetical protein